MSDTKRDDGPRGDDGDDDALVAELRRLDDGPEPPAELWQAMAAEVRAGYERARATATVGAGETAAAPSAAAPSAAPPSAAPPSAAAPFSRQPAASVAGAPRRTRSWRTRTLVATTSALALAAALTFWLRPAHPPLPGTERAPHASESFDEMTVFGDEVGPGDELEEMTDAQLDELDSAFKKGA